MFTNVRSGKRVGLSTRRERTVLAGEPSGGAGVGRLRAHARGVAGFGHDSALRPSLAEARHLRPVPAVAAQALRFGEAGVEGTARRSGGWSAGRCCAQRRANRWAPSAILDHRWGAVGQDFLCGFGSPPIFQTTRHSVRIHGISNGTVPICFKGVNSRSLPRASKDHEHALPLSRAEPQT